MCTKSILGSGVGDPVSVEDVVVDGMGFGFSGGEIALMDETQYHRPAASNARMIAPRSSVRDPAEVVVVVTVVGIIGGRGGGGATDCLGAGVPFNVALRRSSPAA